MALTILLTGILLIWLSEAWAAYRAFKLGLSKGLLSLFLPGYVLLLAKRNGYYQSFFVSWVLGIVLLVLGGVVLK